MAYSVAPSLGHDFGKKQDNQIVDDVELPRWARDDPLLFITKHRAVSACFVANLICAHY